MSKSGQEATRQPYFVRRRKKRWPIIVAGAMLMLCAAVLVLFALRDTASFFRMPSEVTAAERAGQMLLRLGGYVEKGSVVRGAGTEASFNITDFHSSEKVYFNGLLPDLFREGQGVIAEGHFANGVFVADRVLARHDERYVPKDIADRLKEQGLWEDYPSDDR